MKRRLCNVEDDDSDEDDEAVPTFGEGEDSSGDDDEDTDRTQLAQDTQLAQEGSEDSLDDLLLQEDSFEGKELKRLHSSWDVWGRYRANYCEEENAHLVAQEAESVSKRNKQLRESKQCLMELGEEDKDNVVSVDDTSSGETGAISLTTGRMELGMETAEKKMKVRSRMTEL
ncbi:hypothetical protein PInf_002865 [Phytophthora infestans]|nr:hypothetical protein PInf_002865 [Phytophthora infestans]